MSYVDLDDCVGYARPIEKYVMPSLTVGVVSNGCRQSIEQILFVIIKNLV
ncbi:hypothetical protein [Muricomes intestini]|jgi:hypothetical protein